MLELSAVRKYAREYLDEVEYGGYDVLEGDELVEDVATYIDACTDERYAIEELRAVLAEMK